MRTSAPPFPVERRLSASIDTLTIDSLGSVVQFEVVIAKLTQPFLASLTRIDAMSGAAS